MSDGHQNGTILPFSELRVLELSNTVAGAYCARLMAGLGATVIKVEPPRTGDPIRMLGPFYRDVESIEGGAVHHYLDLGKKSVTVDSATSEGKEVLVRLAAGSDVVLRAQERWPDAESALDYETARRIRPEIIMATISGFGDRGQYSGYIGTEGVAMALGGLTSLSGDPGDTPLQSGGHTAHYAAGAYAATAVTGAIFQKRFTGEGQHVEVSVTGTVASLIEITSQRLVIQGKTPERTGNWQGPGRGIYPAEDGHIGVVMRGRDKMGEIVDWLGVEELKDERFTPFSKNEEMAEGLDEELNGLLTVGLLNHGKLETYHAIQALHVPFGYVANFAEVLESPQHNERDYFAEVDDPELGRQKYPKGPFATDSMEWRMEAAPRLGEHTEEVLRGTLEYSDEEYSELHRNGVV